MPFLWAKVLVFQGSAHQNGVGSLSNTIIRKEIRQHKIVPIWQYFSTYLIPIKKNLLLIDTRFFTASVTDL